ncbi:zinc finger and BTB domain-containing protein 44 isoform X3 [Hyalella azteca]|uniref:Zinc finger and BTB domain-containing protein 44 isoform X3 n=1 Tax=Hyalella azteca TaxID=294128 RepID=A0A8B7NS97_HYAAZ|nr:zinc finger and BTB domain-containing protein 44 isoform X3 [Hyalella azteca]
MDSNGSQCFCLRWNNFQSSVVTVMRTLLQDRAFLDVTLACDGRSLQAHRLVLASCSDFFSDVLKENQTEHPIIFLRDVSFWELEAIMDFIYNGQVNIMREQLPGFIRTACALQIKGLAAVNNNNSPFNFNNNSCSPTSTSNPFSFNSSISSNNEINSFLNYNNNNINSVNNNIIAAVNNNNNDSKFSNRQLEPMALDTKFRVRSQSPRASPPIAASPPTTPSFKKRRHDSPIPLPLSSPRFGDPEGPPRSLDEDGPNLKSSSPFGITDTIQSLAFSANSAVGNTMTSVASMASISVAKAISLSKLVHEISSQASIASLKSASLPPHHTSLPPDELVNGDLQPHTPPPQQPLPHLPSAHLHNTKDWASSKNEDGFPACSLCGKVFKHQGSLVAHYQVHQQRTKCPVCQKVLSRHYHMKVHLLTVHKVPDSEIDSLLRTQCV